MLSSEMSSHLSTIADLKNKGQAAEIDGDFELASEFYGQALKTL